MKRHYLLLPFLIVVAFVTTVWGQEYPQKGKPINLVVGYPAGGGADQAARLLASLMEKELGTSITVVSKPGAGGQLGLTELVRSKPDGYTLGYALFPFLVTSPMDPRRQAIYKRTSFQPIATQFQMPKVVVVPTDSPFKTLKDLVDAAKANPEKIKAAAGGVLGDTHLALLQLQKSAGIKLALVHFDGGAPNLTALLGKHVDVGFHVPAEILSQTRAGALRALGVNTKEESPFFPGVKTLEAQGYFGVDVTVIGGLIAPAGVPKEAVEVLGKAAKTVIESAEHKKRLTEMGYSVFYQNAEQYTKQWLELDEHLKPTMEEALKAQP